MNAYNDTDVINKVVIPESCINVVGRWGDYKYGVIGHRLSQYVIMVESMTPEPRILRSLFGAPERIASYKCKFDLEKSNKLAVLLYLICYSDGISADSTCLQTWEKFMDLSLLAISDFENVCKVCYKKYLGSLSKLEECEMANNPHEFRLLNNYAQERVVYRLGRFLECTSSQWNSSEYVMDIFDKVQRARDYCTRSCRFR